MIYKRGKVYWYKFMFNGDNVRESTKQRNDKVARQMESAHRVALAKGEVNIREKKAAPTLAEFLKKDCTPFWETKHADKAATLRYYKTGAQSLIDSGFGSMRLDEITDQQGQQYAAKHPTLSPSTINCGLRTLRRAIYLAAEWGTIAGRPRIRLVGGERQRERVLNDSEVSIYLAACAQPWRDCATLILGTAMRPGEVFALRWENISFKDGGTIQVTQGKSKAARRILPMLPIVRAVFNTRSAAHGHPSDGWVFPSSAAGGHFDNNSAKNQHGAALRQIKDTAEKQNQPTPLGPFEPYCLRHTALTRLGESGCDAFTLARIAGHSDIKITMRYVHPQIESVSRAFARLDEYSQPVKAEITQKGGHRRAGGHKTGHSQKPRLLPAAPIVKKAYG